MFSISNLLKVNSLPIQGQRLVEKYILYLVFSNSLVLFSSTFFVLHVIDIVDFDLTGFLYALMFLVIAITDYPTGNLANRYGHKVILTLSFFLFGISYLLLVISDAFYQLVIVFVLLGIANSQLTGTLQSWFENNYKLFSQEYDPRKEIFKEMQGRITMIMLISSAFTFVLGGYFADRVGNGRIAIFFLQGIGCLLLAIIFFITLPNIVNLDEETASEQNYWKMIKEELNFIKSNKVLLFFVIGQVILFMSLVVFDILIVFPLYFGYTGSDFGAGVLRFFLYIIIGLYSSFAGKRSIKMSEKKWIPILAIMSTTIAFCLTALLIEEYPVQDRYDAIPLTLLIFVFLFHGSTIILYNILVQKLYLDLIPDIHRNSFYSLIPTIGLLFAAPVVYFSGSITKSFGLSTTMLIIAIITIFSSLFILTAMKNYIPLHEPSNLDQKISMELGSQNYIIAISENPVISIPIEYRKYQEAHEIFNMLITVAKKDNVITFDEKKLILNIMQNIIQYTKLIEHANEDGIITEDQKQELYEFRDYITSSSYDEALSDEVISDDENELLEVLTNIIKLLHEGHSHN